MRSYRERITIQSPTPVDAGYGQTRDTYPVDSYVPGLRELAAKYEYIRGAESFRGVQVQADMHAFFEIRTPPVPILLRTNCFT